MLKEEWLGCLTRLEPRHAPIRLTNASPGDMVCHANDTEGTFGIVVATYEASPRGTIAVVLWTNELKLTYMGQVTMNAAQQIMAEEDAHIFSVLNGAEP